MANAQNYTKMLAESMQNTKEVISAGVWGSIGQDIKLPIYKLHMHAKKDWRVLELRDIGQGRQRYFIHSSYKTYREAQAIMKLMEE
jgi:hypothetical protein